MPCKLVRRGCVTEYERRASWLMLIWLLQLTTSSRALSYRGVPRYGAVLKRPDKQKLASGGCRGVGLARVQETRATQDDSRYTVSITTHA
jgi:hypothetical protein